MRTMAAALVIASLVWSGAAQEHVPAQEPKQIAGSVVDVRAMARQQIEAAKKTPHVRVQQSNAMGNVNSVLLIPSIIISLLGTTGLMWWLMRHSHQKPAEPVIQMAPPPQKKKEDPVSALLHQAQLIMLEKRVQKVPRVHTGPPAPDTGTTLARTFGRGRGELMLAQKLETNGRQYPWQKKVEEDGTGVSGANIATTAKKLGMGTGELHLLNTLRVLKDQQEEGNKA